jgi:class 3 adenylate cyclase
MFLDVAGYSKLKSAQLNTYFAVVLPRIAKALEPHWKHFVEVNTWGDGIVIVCNSPPVLAQVALEMRDIFLSPTRSLEDETLPDLLQCRMALHAGMVYLGFDPIRRRQGVVGSQVALAAKIEPVVRPGQVWVTDSFRNLIADLGVARVEFDDFGEQELAKQFGRRRVYNMRRSTEPKSAVPERSNHFERPLLSLREHPEKLLSMITGGSEPSPLFVSAGDLDFISGWIERVFYEAQAFGSQKPKINHIIIKRISDDAIASLAAIGGLPGGFEARMRANIRAMKDSPVLQHEGLVVTERTWNRLPPFHGFLYSDHALVGPWETGLGGILHHKTRLAYFSRTMAPDQFADVERAFGIVEPVESGTHRDTPRPVAPAGQDNVDEIAAQGPGRLGGSWA